MAVLYTNNHCYAKGVGRKHVVCWNDVMHWWKSEHFCLSSFRRRKTRTRKTRDFGYNQLNTVIDWLTWWGEQTAVIHTSHFPRAVFRFKAGQRKNSRPVSVGLDDPVLNLRCSTYCCWNETATEFCTRTHNLHMYCREQITINPTNVRKTISKASSLRRKNTLNRYCVETKILSTGSLLEERIFWRWT